MISFRFKKCPSNKGFDFCYNKLTLTGWSRRSYSSKDTSRFWQLVIWHFWQPNGARWWHPDNHYYVGYRFKRWRARVALRALRAKAKAEARAEAKQAGALKPQTDTDHRYYFIYIGGLEYRAYLTSEEVERGSGLETPDFEISPFGYFGDRLKVVKDVGA